MVEDVENELKNGKMRLAIIPSTISFWVFAL
jgi:hypothetical protein